MRIQNYLKICLGLSMLITMSVFSQTSTSWIGGSTNWSTSSNWTNGVPNSAVDAIIGDASFTGSNQPNLSASSSCKSLTIGNGTKTSTLTLDQTLTVSGNVLIGTNGTINHSNGVTFSLSGDWTKYGNYTTLSTSDQVTFNGTTQSINGGTAFRKLTINAGSTVTLNANISASRAVAISGTFNPNESPTYLFTGSNTLTVNNGGKLLVKAELYSQNFTGFSGTTFNTGSTVEYASTTTNQTISSSYTYSTLRISGATTKSLSANLNALSSVNSSDGNIVVTEGTFDLSSYTANRGTTVAGGTLTVSNGATLKVAGTKSLPSNYATHSFGGTSTVEYSGADQTIDLESFGNLSLSSSGGSAIKTLPSTSMTIGGNFSTSIGGGTSVSVIANAALTINGNVSLGSSTTFDGSSFTHNIIGNWTNNGTFTGNTSTINFSGTNAVISGTGNNNFNNVVISGNGVTSNSVTNINIDGNISTSGTGTFSHAAGDGILTMSGASKTISGTGITFGNLTITNSVTTTTSFSIAGNFVVNGTFSASLGTMTISGSSKSISGSGTITMNAINVTGTISTSASFSLNSYLTVSGSLSATSGAVTFSGTTTLSGTANLFNVILNGTKLQLGTGSVLGVAGSLTLSAGTFDVTSTTPNTVDFNSTSSQSVIGTTYNNVSFSGNATKTAGSALTVNGDISINAGATFNASFYTHSLYGNWTNNGTFTASTSTIQFVGGNDAAISGASTFNILTENKNSSSNNILLNSNVSVATLNMTSGKMTTGNNAVTITTTRTGGGIILGTISRTHIFSNGTSYAFEGPFNTITFASGGAGISSVSVTVTSGAVSDFPFGGSVNREYNVSVTGGAYNATLRLHYDDAELNGNSETAMSLWKYSGSWSSSGKTSNSSTDNWVELNSLTNIGTRWTLSEDVNAARWNGSVSSAWENVSNWTAVQGVPSLPPSANDIAQLGTVSFVNQPIISSAVSVKSIKFGSVQAAVLSVNSGSLTTSGNIGGTWSADAAHTISIGAQSMSIGGDIDLSDGTTGRTISLSASTGTITISGSLTQSGGAVVSFTGAGNLNIGSNYNFSNGTFSANTSTVTYNGAGTQTVAPVTYYHLTFDKTLGTATLSSSASVNGNFTLSTNGTFEANANLIIAGNVSIGAGTTMNGNGSTISVGGDWTNNGTFTASTGTVVFNGSSSQAVSTTTFNNLTVNKTAGILSPSGNLTVNGDFSFSNGTVNLASYSLSRSSIGGTFSLASGTTLNVGGANNFPSNFATNSLASSSTVEYNSTVSQSVAAMTYGNLSFSNGGSNAKTLLGSSTVAGNFVINSGASFNAGSYSLSIQGNWSNNGTFTPSTSSIALSGTSKTLNGNSTFNNLNVTGVYTATDNVTVNGTMDNDGTFTTGNTTFVSSGDFLNSGNFSNSGTVTFSGTNAQTIVLNSGFTSSGTVNFNGTSAPTMSGTSSPNLTNVNINNTSGVAVEVNWTIGGNFSVGSGTTFSGGSSSHTFQSNFTNNGTVTSNGTINFSPTGSVTLTLLGTSFSSAGTVNFSGIGLIALTGGNPNFAQVNVSNTNISGIVLVSNWNASGSVTIENGALLNAGSNLTHTISGNFTNNGTFTANSSTIVLNSGTSANITGTSTTTFNNITIAGAIDAVVDFNVVGNFTNNGTFNAAGTTVTFSGSSPSIISGSTSPTQFYNLDISKTSSSVTLNVPLTGISSLNVSNGTFDISSFTVSQSGSGTLTLALGTFLKIGGTNSLPTFDTYALSNNSTVEYYGTGTQIISAVNYGNLTSSNSGNRILASSGTIGIARTFTPGTNSYTVTGSTIDFNGSEAQTIPLFHYNNLTSSNSGNRILASSGTIGIAGTFAPGTNSYTITGSTIDFNGNGAQTIPGFVFNNFSTSGSGTKTLSANTTVNGTIALTSGSFDVATFILTAKGDVENDDAVVGSGKILLSGSTAAHSLSGNGSFTNLELNDANGATFSSDVTVNGTMTMMNGNITTNANKLVMSSSGNLSRTSGHIIGNLQKNIPTGSPSVSFEIGDATYYTPATITFANVTSSGNLTMKTTPNDHSDIANSGIKTEKSVNRFWTLTNNGTIFDSYNAVFNYVANDVDAGSNTNFFIAKNYNGVLWSSVFLGTVTATSAQISNVTSFGDFQIGESTNNPVPSITTISPTNKNVGGSGFMLTVTGNNFVFGSVIRFNGSDRTTTYTSVTEISAPILASDLDSAGTFYITVFNPAPAGGTSNAEPFTVNGGTISGTVFDDVDGNGIKDVGESGLQNWKIKISGAGVDSQLTDISGNYSFSDLHSGTFSVSEELQNGWIQIMPSSPSSYSISLGGATINFSGNNFGNFHLGTISGTTFNDLDGDGTKDIGEPGLESWRMRLAGPVTDSMFTDANGNYSFGNITVGNYTITEALQNGWIHTIPVSPSSYSISVSSGTNATNRDFGNYQISSISGNVFNDLDGDGTKDLGEPGLSNWKIKISGAASDSVYTNASGNFSFNNLLAGNYTLFEDLQSGWKQTIPVSPTSYPILITSGTNATNRDFGNFQLVGISGTTFNDENGNGLKDAGESGLSNWKIKLSGAKVDSQLTDGNGNYAFTNLVSGNYSLSEVAQNGWIQTHPSSPGTYSFSVSSGTNYPNTNFGNYQLAGISGQVFDDVNGNGSKDDGENGLQNWKIKISGVATDSVFTNASGNFSFTNLLAGNYTVSFVIQSGWIQTMPIAPGTYSLTITSGQNATAKDFGAFQLGTISGTKFLDADGDGVKDLGESGIVNWKIKISGAKNDSVLTDANGNFSFTSLNVGNYSVSEVAQNGWLQTLPVSGGSYSVTITSGTNATGKNFGNFQYGILSGQTFNDADGDGVKDLGESGIVNWKIKISGAKNDSVLTDANGNYMFSTLTYGNYTVSEVQQIGWSQTFPVAGTYSISVASGSVFSGKDFGNFQHPVIGGMKFNDINGNGIKEENESGLANWKIKISGPENDSMFTDAGGNYLFSDLSAGTYTISEVQQNGWTQTYPLSTTYTVSLSSGVNTTGKDFGNFKLGTISGILFNDYNGNGIREGGESGIVSWKIYLYKTDTLTLIDSAITSDEGYTFANVTVGTYYVREKVQSGWMQTSAHPSAIIITSGTNSASNNFGNFQLGNIGGMKFSDANGNGAKDVGEIGLQNWVIKISGQKNDSVITDANGNYLFSGLSAGTYTVSEVAQSGWTQTMPSFPGTYFVTITSGFGATGKDFGDVQLGSISGQNFNDSDGDGMKDAGEVGLQNWKIKLSGGKSDSALTDVNGNYSFINLLPGAYILQREQQSGWLITAPVNPSLYVVFLSTGQSATNYDFGNFQYGTISGTTFDDANGNGTRDVGEQSLDSFYVSISGAQSDTVMTDSSGNYVFSELTPGTYTVSEISRVGWAQTYPTNPNTYSVVMTSGGIFTGKDFGNYNGSLKFRTFTISEITGKAAKLKFGKNDVLKELPNQMTAVANVFVKIGKSGATFLGLAQTEKDSAKKYGWIHYKNAAAIVKLYTSSHSGTAYPIDYLRIPGKKNKKLSKAINASRMQYDNSAWEQGVLFNLNLKASEKKVTPEYFGDLLLDTTFILMGKQLYGMSLTNMGKYLDSIMTYYEKFGVTNDAAYDEVRLFVSKVLKPINAGFATTFSISNSWIDTTKVKNQRLAYEITLLGIKTAGNVGIVKQLPTKPNDENIGIGEYDYFPSGISLEQNYPNPFNPTTTIRFEIPVGAIHELPLQTTLKVYDVLGREVATLLNNEPMEEGEHEVQFDANGLTSGVYFYRLQTENIVQTRKMILLK
ncbi:MAG: T9SS type A sorting domain-containing protein [Ignavibacteria bacterium]|nr:T9SS type A sorting domain-containing protein [Ignavibacteria bacterium]